MKPPIQNKKISKKERIKHIQVEKQRISRIYQYFVEVYRDGIIKESLLTGACHCIASKTLTLQETTNWLEQFFKELDTTDSDSVKALIWVEGSGDLNSIESDCIEIAESDLNLTKSKQKPLTPITNMAKASKKDQERHYKFYLDVRQEYQVMIARRIALIRILIELLLSVIISFVEKTSTRKQIENWYLTWLKQNSQILDKDKVDDFNEALGITDLIKNTPVFEKEEMAKINQFLVENDSI